MAESRFEKANFRRGKMKEERFKITERQKAEGRL